MILLVKYWVFLYEQIPPLLLYIENQVGLKTIILFLALCFSEKAWSQLGFMLDPGRKRSTINFKLVRNLVVVKMHINNAGPYNFVIDTGVGLMLITDPALSDSLHLTNRRTIKVAGLGSGEPIEAEVTTALSITLPGITGSGISAAILKKDHFGLSSYAGIHIHGLIGYDFFKSFMVGLNFNDSTLTVYNPQHEPVLLRKGYKIPFTLEGNKPYIIAKTYLPDGNVLNAKLIVDIGAGHPLSLESYNIRDSGVKYIVANLGIGLTGPIDGYISRIPAIEIGKYKLNQVITSFPDGNEYGAYANAIKRDGNLGLGILKKFNILFDYAGNAMYLKPNMSFKQPFEHDMSGLEYYVGGSDLDHLIISRVEPGSPASSAGLMANDEIISINFTSTKKLSMQAVDNLLKSKENRNILIEFYRDKAYKTAILTLKKRI